MASGSGPVWCSLKFWCGRPNPINLQDARPSYMSHISESPHKSFPHFMLVRNKSTTSSPGSVSKPLSSPVAELMLFLPPCPGLPLYHLLSWDVLHVLHPAGYPSRGWRGPETETSYDLGRQQKTCDVINVVCVLIYCCHRCHVQILIKGIHWDCSCRNGCETALIGEFRRLKF